MNRLTIVMSAVALVVGLTAGTVVGYASQQGPIVAAQASAAKEKAKDKADYEARAAELAQREVDLNSREAKIEAGLREMAKIKAELDAQIADRKANSFGDGVWVVGRDIQPGTYRAAQSGSDCYWAKLRADEGIIKNDIPGGPTTVDISGDVPKFKSSRCGTWTKIG